MHFLKIIRIMTVEQFIEELQEFPKDAKIAITGLDLRGHETSCPPSPKYYKNHNTVYL